MRVVKVKKIKDDYLLILDNDQELIVDEDILVKHRLLAGTVMDDKLYEELAITSDNFMAYKRALKYINTRLRSVKQMRAYLKKIEATDIDHIINKLITNGYLDDKRYASTYVHDTILLKSDGPLKITNDLLQEDIIEEYIVNALQEYDNDFFAARCQKIVNKKIKSYKGISEYHIKQKIDQYLYTLGYPKSITSRILVTSDKNDLMVLKEIIDAMLQKYDHETIIKKCQQKGFNYYDIVNILNEIN